ncbi:hypothetical protein JCM11491_001384 [Sporobolomyces phaffii]
MSSSSLALTFALPPLSVTPEKRIHPPSPAAASAGADNFFVRLSRRISQSGATLKRRVSSKGQKAPVRRASEADKENRSTNRAAAKDPMDDGNPARDGETRRNEETPRKATLKRGLRVSVIRRTRSEGAPASTAGRRPRPVDIEAAEELVDAPREPSTTETKSEVSSHRGSYFYSNSLGVCWDGRERVHPDAFLFKPYSSDADVLPSPVIASDRVVYASTLSSFPPRPPLRPRTPPLPTPASLIAAEYRALHPKTPSIYSFSDFDTPPSDSALAETTLSLPTHADNGDDSPAPPPLEPLLTTYDDLHAPRRYSSSVHSSTASSRPSRGEPLTPALSEDSSTSLETLARDGHRPRLVGGDDDTRGRHASSATEKLPLPRIALVDSGPIPPLRPKPSIVLSEASSTIDTWRDCEE